jgi:hypothetical protein
MRKQLESMQSTLYNMIARAEQFSESENEDTAAKYDDVLNALQTALEGVGDAIDILNG